MPPQDKEFRVKVTLEGMESFTAKVQEAVQKALDAVKMPGLEAEEATEPEGRPKEGALSQILAPFGDVLKKLTGGLFSKEGLGGLLGALGGGAAGGKLAGTAGAAAGGMAGGGIGMLMGPLVTMATMLAGVLENLAPIQAVMKVIGAIMQLVMLPLAMVLMAILMPFLMPLLQLLGRLPWASIFKATQDISAGVSDFIGLIEKYWPYIEDIVFPIVGIWNYMKWIYSMFSVLLPVLYAAIVGGLKELWSVLKQIWDVADGIYTWFIGVMASVFKTINSVIGDVWGVLTTIWNWFWGTMGPVWQDIQSVIHTVSNVLSTIANALNATGNAVGNAGATLNPMNWNLPSFASGGYVPQNTLALIHGGETVVPKGGGTGMQITVNVTGNTISNQMDMNRIANQVAQMISDKARLFRTW